MNAYVIALFLHVIGALGYFATVGVLLIAVERMRRVTTTAALREWGGLAAAAEQWVPVSAALLVLSGGYLVVTSGGWRAAWIVVALGALLVVVPLFPLVLGRRLNGIRDVMQTGTSGGIPPVLTRQIHDPVLLGTLRLVTALSLGIVFLMTVKPDLMGSLVTLGATLILGFAAAFPVRRAYSLTGIRR